MNWRALFLVSFAACVQSSCATGGKNAWRDEERNLGYRLELVVDGAPLPVHEHRGRSYVEGRAGYAYAVRFFNESPHRVEVMVAVDGRDVIDGKPFDPDRRGYVVAPFTSIDIPGWRTSMDAVAAFRFTSREDAYASRMGSPGELGQIEAAVFVEKESPRGPIVMEPASGPGVPAPDGIDWRKTEARSAGAPLQAERERGRLGTQFGERLGAQASETEFVREGARPQARLYLRYDDATGLCNAGLRDFCERPRPLVLTPPSPPPAPPDQRFSNPPPGWQGGY